MRVYHFSIVVLFILLSSCSQKVQVQNTIKTNEKLSYKTFDNDPTALRLYTLDNGLKVYLSKNNDAPKIETFIAVKAGSTYDPKDQTGLAHYLEHMLFKGTSTIGTKNWQKEKVLLNEISNLYEKHKFEKDVEKKKLIYRKIDSVSNKAAEYAIANEYDKMISSIGAQGTNAFTSNEVTAYINKIPSNELDKWLAVESERFSELVLRLFHTELETVYEEFNRGQDNDNRKQYQAVLTALFPTHPYGTQTTIGIAEHLKNPSMKEIHNYFDTYYVSNNMAIIMVGDLDFDTTIKKVAASFGNMKPKQINKPQFAIEKPIVAPIKKEIFGPSAESVYLAYRTPGKKSKDTAILTLIDYLFTNSTAGLIDLNINSKQKAQSVSSYYSKKKDYGVFSFYGKPKQNQSLEEVVNLILNEIENLKSGNFDDWLIDAVINDLVKTKITQTENAKSVANAYLYSFAFENEWSNEVKLLEDIKQLSKQDVIDFSKTFFKDNYVVVKKRVGEDPNQVKVENPKITPITVNREDTSGFVNTFNKIPSTNLQVQTIDFNKAIDKDILSNGILFSSIENTTNALSTLILKFPVGNDYDRELKLAYTYLEYLGTNSFTNEEIKKEFYKLGINYSFSVVDDETNIVLSGLQENLSDGLELLLTYLNDLKPDEQSYENLISSFEKSRNNRLKSKSDILWKGLMSYSKYGENSRIRNNIPIEDLKEITPEHLIDKVAELFNFKPEVFYYGNNKEETVSGFESIYIQNFINEKGSLISPNKIANPYKEKETLGDVYFVNYDMVQAELLLVSKEEQYSLDKIALSMLFNTYFGSGLSSIVFQEIRESKSLAYSAMSRYSLASEKDKSNYLFAYMGTQANKLPEAVKAMKSLLNEMPLNSAQFEAAKSSVLKTLAAKRTTKTSIYYKYNALNKLGLNYDNSSEIYNKVKTITLSDLNDFFNKDIKNSKFDMMVLGNKKDIDFNTLEQFGEVKELTAEFLFNY